MLLHQFINGFLGNARIAMQIDLGFSDVVTPRPVDLIYPTLLDQPAPMLKAYNHETAIAEKFEAMVKLEGRAPDSFVEVWREVMQFLKPLVD
ncbi:MAG: hypothetical protein DRP60_07580 [Spirochaetes bacterium]|nr:MAG: hypothetical protein DRP60_07580 [Spirochaetota bacterium]